MVGEGCSAVFSLVFGSDKRIQIFSGLLQSFRIVLAFAAKAPANETVILVTEPMRLVVRIVHLTGIGSITENVPLTTLFASTF